MSGWTPQEQLDCLEIWEAGASYSITGLRVGKTRNAVAGWLNRQGKHRAVSNETLPPFRGGTPPANGGFPRRPRPKALPAPAAPPLAPLILLDHNVPLNDRADCGCVFPYGRSPYTFCNQMKATGQSYCAFHYGVVYQTRSR